MPWKELTCMSQRREFIAFVTRSERVNFRKICRQMGISTKTGYKWLHRYLQEGLDGLKERSRRPHHSPERTRPEVEKTILAYRDLHSQWGPRKLRGGLVKKGCSLPLPSCSTISAILQRSGCIDPQEAAKHQPWQHFERAVPNELWQMDFKGYFSLWGGTPSRPVHPEVCHPLTIIDDHSRFAVGLVACAGETFKIVQVSLISIFRRYGLPEAFLTDNGPPWGSRGEEYYTQLKVWLLRLDIPVYHSRICHPQTHGKNERFNRTLKAEVITGRAYHNLASTQRAFDTWRDVYNYERPHEALQLDVPGDHYEPSRREYPELLPTIIYGADAQIRKVQGKGEISFHNRVFTIGKAFSGFQVALRATTCDGLFDVYFCHQRICQLSLITNLVNFHP
jgi:transposase InsO family protein